MLTILSSSQLRTLLLSLTREEILSLQRNLANALHEYSTGTQEAGCAASYQPPRTAITRQDGRTTLFMPASTGQTVGIKMISLKDPAGGDNQAGCVVDTHLSVQGSSSRGSRSPRGHNPRDSMASVASDLSDLSISSQEDNNYNNSSNLLGSSVASSSGNWSSGETSEASSLPASGCVNRQSVSSTLGAWPGAGTRDTSPRGSVTLLDAQSEPFGLISAQELTAFRTALSALMLFTPRRRVRTLTVFGAGRQAYWHIRLALTLRRDEIKRVYILNRSFERAAALLRDIYSAENSGWRGGVKFSAMSSDFVEYTRLRREAVRKADVIFCCTPAVEPLFPAELLTAREGRQKGRLVSAVGSYKPHMAELHPDILRDEADGASASHRHYHKHTPRSGVVVVDSLEAALQEAGEIVQSGLQPQQLVELGELLMVKRATEGGSDEEKSLHDWVERGNVVYKSVGLGLMDLVTGGDLIRLARERNIGTTVEDF
ncbi:hypothetical protein ASPZODRAFT_131326 [Penicilliopsis zonata CBS 506.65]|uniref:Ornithine cyclodeaminase n=1 Tax=Penicilliopsis zonata CBS 506.65 TaxID=1073090 RepID=A0A1L9SKK9_9EURO|nr:hypothetical protein ASPZODRAFT_131326 [Penicilliopsis zonata CBS 506.65]OJJ47762.1 hypothetical protein ASPZODRAFT_131326 [Penicilliopsis zonata CBS 506.65]